MRAVLPERIFQRAFNWSCGTGAATDGKPPPQHEVPGFLTACQVGFAWPAPVPCSDQPVFSLR
ncbi:MAG TPA: hypothetical protein DC058_17650 [Planctomycetaceae bacterium]|nr:hypothetical protein [Planctomycetaceae bacterium]HBC63024.1 hypothetical protein [Planctomycetaceae bacterium]